LTSTHGLALLFLRPPLMEMVLLFYAETSTNLAVISLRDKFAIMVLTGISE